MVAAEDEQRDDPKVERQRQGRKPQGRVTNAQFPAALSRAHLISGAVVKL